MCHKMTSLEGFITALDFVQNQHTKYFKKERIKDKPWRIHPRVRFWLHGGACRAGQQQWQIWSSLHAWEWNLQPEMIIYKGISIFLNMNLINDLITWSVSPNWTSFSDLSWPRYLTRPLRASPSATARKLRSMGWKK